VAVATIDEALTEGPIGKHLLVPSFAAYGPLATRVQQGAVPVIGFLTRWVGSRRQSMSPPLSAVSPKPEISTARTSRSNTDSPTVSMIACRRWRLKCLDERSGQGSFGQYYEPTFVTSDQVATSKKADQRQYKHDGRQRVVNLKQRLAKDEAAKTEHRGPDDAARRIGHQKCAPRHAIQSSEECRQYTQ
jgi:hypothetical protein